MFAWTFWQRVGHQFLSTVPKHACEDALNPSRLTGSISAAALLQEPAAARQGKCKGEYFETPGAHKLRSTALSIAARAPPPPPCSIPCHICPFLLMWANVNVAKVAEHIPPRTWRLNGSDPSRTPAELTGSPLQNHHLLRRGQVDPDWTPLGPRSDPAAKSARGLGASAMFTNRKVLDPVGTKHGPR